MRKWPAYSVFLIIQGHTLSSSESAKAEPIRVPPSRLQQPRSNRLAQYSVTSCSSSTWRRSERSPKIHCWKKTNSEAPLKRRVEKSENRQELNKNRIENRDTKEIKVSFRRQSMQPVVCEFMIQSFFQSLIQSFIQSSMSFRWKEKGSVFVCF